MGLDAFVKVASDADVQHTLSTTAKSTGSFTGLASFMQIEYANKHRNPFLGIGGGHGGSRALNTVPNGRGIWLRGHNSGAVI